MVTAPFAMGVSPRLRGLWLLIGIIGGLSTVSRGQGEPRSAQSAHRPCAQGRILPFHLQEVPFWVARTRCFKEHFYVQRLLRHRLASETTSVTRATRGTRGTREMRATREMKGLRSLRHHPILGTRVTREMKGTRDSRSLQHPFRTRLKVT